MAEKGVVKRPRQIIGEMTLRWGEDGAGTDLVRHHRKIFRKFTQLPRVSKEEEYPAWLVKPMQGK
jgi:hypothetical protein